MAHSAKMAEWPGQSGAILALDTSTAALAAAVVRDGEVLAEVQSLAERNHSVQSVPQVKQLIASAGVAPESLAAIAVGRGPGSYTGMRIAVTVGKTLSWVWKVPLVGVSSLEALACGSFRATGSDAGGNEGARASGMPGKPEWIVPLMDARRGQVYTALFQAEGDADARSGAADAVAADRGWIRKTDDGIRPMHDWVEELAEWAKRSDSPPAAIRFTGDLSLHEAEAERLGVLLAESGILAVKSPQVMEGRAIAWLGARRLLRGETDAPHTFVPNYTQLAEAEVKLLAKRQGE
ncbi:MAG TPA: tRNA (adenosine(37)-N6)-threonylcarbamoyltransferase complex dimerization subunit type 1 TsaB [Paenibacillus sp.]|uniref:tRNA (adenosine(37)-N6)-threonylcarbamoyltransferase complex dimerization subunit type 1 TsaB n=1 Tax=Paenibacillus sp. TaxID=58172 RepID=UPI002BA081D9|nr:tRNA (adenosine(37)-N6)-threonylcarbamoyltransferase complex dimerization subunit type 1 TsaB [Paenibacillus sp.]HUC92259.1 tRNA (adenosine(37)-N6)-threonylcarbamoyltransferase complex dimerization subunit type 1 TsaB [Paenibacillus sp.]